MTKERLDEIRQASTDPLIIELLDEIDRLRDGVKLLSEIKELEEQECQPM
jgi:hypothetical protein